VLLFDKNYCFFICSERFYSQLDVQRCQETFYLQTGIGSQLVNVLHSYNTNTVTIITRKMYRIDDELQSKRGKLSQAPGYATVLERFCHNNFIIFRLRSKRIAFLESVNFSMCGYVQIFNFCDGHVTTFRHPSGAYICQMHGHRLQTSKRHTFRVSAFHWYHWFGVKLFAVGYAQDSRRVHLKCDKCCFFIWLCPCYKISQFLLGRLPKVDLIILEGGKMSVRPSTKSFFDFNEIWYTGRGR